MSQKLIIIVDELLSNQNIVNLVGLNENFPTRTNVNPKDIAPMGKRERITVTPFDSDFVEDVRSEIRVYYPEFAFENNNQVNDAIIAIDIIVHKNIWLMEANGEKVIRPYHIASEIFDHFQAKEREKFKEDNIKKLGKLMFLEGRYVLINKEFDCLRLFARTLDF